MSQFLPLKPGLCNVHVSFLQFSSRKNCIFSSAYIDLLFHPEFYIQWVLKICKLIQDGQLFLNIYLRYLMCDIYHTLLSLCVCYKLVMKHPSCAARIKRLISNFNNTLCKPLIGTAFICSTLFCKGRVLTMLRFILQHFLHCICFCFVFRYFAVALGLLLFIFTSSTAWNSVLISWFHLLLNSVSY